MQTPSNSSYEDILLKILDIVGYEKDKKKYVDDLIVIFQSRAITKLARSFPVQKQDELKLLAKSDPKKCLEQIVQESGQDKYVEVLRESAKTSMTELLNTLMPTLSEKQKEDLKTYFASLSPSSVSLP